MIPHAFFIHFTNPAIKLECFMPQSVSTAELFKETDYVVVRNLIEVQQAAQLYAYTLKNLDAGNLKDDQAIGSPSFYQDKEMIELHQALLPKVESLTKLKLLPTFCYYRTYRTGAILKAHKDRKSCQISISLNLGQQGKLWDIWLIDHDENACNITLGPGDGLLYRGCKLLHGRGKLINADYVSQVFFFFVTPHGRGKFILMTEQIKKWLKKLRNRLGIVSY